MCVLFIWLCFLGLLFLAVKEERFAGEVTIAVRTADHRTWSESVPVTDTASRDHVLSRVAWAQTMASRASFNQS